MERRDQSENLGNSTAVIEAADGNVASELLACRAAGECHGQ